MNFESDLELRHKLLQFLKNEFSLKEFEEWFVPRSWQFNENATPALKSLVGDIELLLAEYSNKDWTQEELRAKIAPLINTYRADYSFNRPQEQTPTIVTTFSGSASPHFGSLKFFDIRPVVVSGLPVHP